MADDLRLKVVNTSWYYRIGERLAANKLREFCRSVQSEETQKARDYRTGIDETFFARTPLHRARALYDLYQRHPRVAGTMIEYEAEEGDRNRASVWAGATSRGCLARPPCPGVVRALSASPPRHTPARIAWAVTP